MSLLYPLLFKPIYKEKIWGGHQIRNILNKDFAPLPNCGELWALSGIEGSESMVMNGSLKNNTLPELLEIFMEDLVGDSVYERFGNEFPLLLKFLNAEDFLSVQVHPGDELAWERHQCSGKTEMWYIIHALSGAGIFNGFAEAITPEAYLKSIQDNTLTHHLQFQKVESGNHIFIPSGRIHAVGPGILLAEIQQPSDITYRIYDFDRIDRYGMKRELHNEMALKAINFDDINPPIENTTPKPNQAVRLEQTPYFNVSLIQASQPIDFDLYPLDSFTAFLGIHGQAQIVYNHKHYPLLPGEAMLIPAAISEISIIPQPSYRILQINIPPNNIAL